MPWLRSCRLQRQRRKRVKPSLATMIANLAFSKPFPETAPGPSRSHIYIYTMHPKWLHEVDMAARSPYQRSLLLPMLVSRPSYLCALRNLRRQVLDLCSQQYHGHESACHWSSVRCRTNPCVRLRNGFFHELHNETIFLTSMNGFPAICSAT